MARGRPARTSHADRVLMRELYRQNRESPKPLSFAEIAEKFGVSHMTARRVIALDEVEMEERRVDEEQRRGG